MFAYNRSIMAEYNDCMERAQRLSAVREAFLEGKSNPNAAIHVKQDDLLIYLRWLVCHLQSLKKFNQFMRVSSVLLPTRSQTNVELST